MRLQPKPILKMSFFEYLATLNFTLILIGYAFVASMLVPFGMNAYETQSVTVPYRIFILLVSTLCIIMGMLKQSSIPKFSKSIIIYFIFFALIIFRVFIDLSTDTTGYAAMEGRRVYGIMAISLTAALSVFYSFKFINFRLALFLIVFMGVFIMTVNSFGFHTTTADMILDTSGQRKGGSVALFSIAYGMVGVTCATISTYVFFSKEYNIFYKAIAIGIFLLGIKTIFAAGSRGPVAAFGIMGIFFCASILRNKFLFFTSIFILSLIAFIFRYEIVGILQDIAPVLGDRLFAMLEDQGFSGRDRLAVLGLEKAISNPILGASTIDPTGYPNPLIGHHSIMIDALANLGLFAGSILCGFFIYLVIITIKMFMNWRIIPFFWVIMLSFDVLIFKILASHSFHTEERFAALITLTILFYNEYYLKRRNAP